MVQASEGFLVNRLDQDNESGLEEWDHFVLACPRGAAGQLSTWLASFRPYGAEFTVFMLQSEASREVVAGIGLLTFGNRWLGWMTAPSGPIIRPEFEFLTSRVLKLAVKYAQEKGMSFVQLQLPTARGQELSALLPDGDYTEGLAAQQGLLVSIGAGARQLKYVQFPGEVDDDEWRDRLLASFSPSTRRNIRLAERNHLELVEARNAPELRDAYAIIEENGRQLGYPTRTWEDFGPTLVAQVRKQHAAVLTARQNGRAVGAHYGLLAGQRYTYSMGGNERISPDPRVGHFLHWSAMQKARELSANAASSTDGNYQSGPTGNGMSCRMGIRRRVRHSGMLSMCPRHLQVRMSRRGPPGV